MALRPITKGPKNKITLETWPHLSEGKIEEGYSLAFASKYGSGGPEPTYPMVVWNHPPDAEDDYDWRAVSPSKWDGISDVKHQGRIVYQRAVIRAVAPPPRARVFQQEFDAAQHSSQDIIIKNFMKREQARTRNKKLIKIAAVGGIAVFACALVKILYFS